MKIHSAMVTAIDSQDASVGGFLRGQQVSRHRVAVTCVHFKGGYKFYTLARLAGDGSLQYYGAHAQSIRIEVGDSFQLMTLPDGLVVSIHPEKIAHLPPRDLAQQAGRN